MATNIAPQMPQGNLTKSAFVGLIADEFGFSKSRSAELLDFMIDTLKVSLRESGEAKIAGFGTFKVASRAARRGKNPRTGEPVDIEESKTVRFKPAPTLKATL